jgi:CheY-specific phosphatase CheX
MDADAWRRVNDMVIECTLATLKETGVAAAEEACESRQLESELTNVAVMGFAGFHMRGAVLLATSDELLMRTFPKPAAEGGAERDALLDWSGELLNHLMGRIKTELGMHGIVIEPGTPTTISGVGVRVGAATRNAHCMPYRFQVDGDSFVVRFEALERPGAELSAQPDESRTVGSPGDVLLF